MTLRPNGHGVLINLKTSGFTLAEERSVKPSGFDVGDGSNMTTNQNTRWRTKMPPALIEAEDITGTYLYDEACLTEIIAAAGQNQEIDLEFPARDGNSTGAKWTFWGYLKSFSPNEDEEQEEPTAEVVIVITNLNASGVETAPALTAAAA